MSVRAPRRRRTGRAFGRLASLVASGLVVVQGVAFFGTAPVALAADPVVAGSLDNGVVNGAYVGFNSDQANLNPQDLSAAGTSDWRIWGRTSTSLAGDDRKAGGAGISTLTDVEGGAAIPLRALGTLGLGVGTGPSTQPFSVKWTDGAATPSATGVRTGLQHNNSTSSLVAGYGFSFTVPTTTEQQTLKVWVSAHHGVGRLVASIGTATYVDQNVVGGQNQGGVYTIDFTGTGAPSETLNVSWTLASVTSPSVTDSSGLPSSEGNAVIYAAALKSAQPAAPAPILVRAATGSNGGILGRVAGAVPNSTQTVTFSTATGCSPVAISQTIGSITVNTDADGAATYAVDISNLPTSGFVTATAKDSTHSQSPYSNCVALGPDNDSWPNALDISATGGNAGSGTPLGYTIDQPGQSRWFKFHVAPGQAVDVNLTGLPADYDLVLFSDINKAYSSLTQATSLTQVSANFAGQAFSAQAFSAQAFSAQAFSPDAYAGQAFSAQAFSADVFAGQAFSAQAFSGQAFSAQAFSGQAFSGQAFSAQAFSGQAFSGQAFSGQAFSAQAFSGQAFSGQAFSGQAFSGQAFSAQAFSAAQVQSVIAVSANGNTSDEETRSNTWLSDGDFYIRVAGKNGVSDLTHPFTLSVEVTGTSCNNVAPYGSAPDPSTAQGVKTVILYDSGRISTTATDAVAAGTEKQDLLTDLNTLAARPEVDGTVVDVAGDPRISHLNQQADANAGCPYAKNLVASALKDIVDSYRTSGNPDLKYVVLVGDDAAIPFFRYPDEALLAPESGFAGVGVKDATASKASLALNYVLSQDQYGSAIQVAVNASSFPTPDLAVGRLVETAAEAKGVVDAYLGTAAGTVGTPTSSFVSGYDFLSDVATTVQQELAGAVGSGGSNGSLIAPNNISHTDPASWTATQLKAALLGSTRHDLVFLGGHFNATSALAADFTSQLTTADLLNSTTDFKNAIVYSAGCHSGYSFVDPDASPGVGSVDWAQAFARKGATLLAGTGYQYGDTDFVMYSEQLYKNFTDQLIAGTGPVSVGDALVKAKREYLSSTPSLRGIDRKALLEATLFGLPMLSVDMPHRIDLTGDTSSVTAAPVDGGPGSHLGLRDATVDLDLSDTSADALTVHHKDLGTIQSDGTTITGPTATWYSGPAGITSKPYEPALPLVDKNVTVPGQTLRGVGFWSGDYTDITGMTPLTGAATEEIRGVHAAFDSPVFYPMRTSEANYFDALANGSTRLLVTPAQHRGETGLTSTLRLYSKMQFKLFYSSLFAPITGADGNTYKPALSGPPSILDLGAVETIGNTVNFDTHVVGDPSAGIQQVWVTYTGWDHSWHSLALTQDDHDSTHWTGSLPIPSGKDAGDLRFIEQAASGVGLVAVADNFGGYYSAVTFNKQSQTITFAATADATFGDGSFTISPTATSGLPVAIDASGKCTVSTTTSPATVTITGAGSCTITASQAGNATFAAATDVPRTFSIDRAKQTITFGSLAGKTVGDADFTVSATASSGLAVSFAATGACSIVGTTVHLTGAGSCTITASQGGNGNYLPAADVSQTFAITYRFDGFLQPINDPNNTAACPAPCSTSVFKAGSTVPVKFQLKRADGTPVQAAALPVFVGATRGSSTTAGVDETVSTDPATSAFRWDATAQQYIFNWSTKGQSAGYNYTLKVKVPDSGQILTVVVALR